MEKLNDLMRKIPALLSSKVSIFVYLFLFFYLVPFALLCAVVPALARLAPSDGIQLIMGNYTNVLSALGASLAAGAGVAVHSGVKSLHQKHDDMQKSLEELHRKVDAMNTASPAQPREEK